MCSIVPTELTERDSDLSVLFEAGPIVASFEKEHCLTFGPHLTQERVDELSTMLN